MRKRKISEGPDPYITYIDAKILGYWHVMLYLLSFSKIFYMLN